MRQAVKSIAKLTKGMSIIALTTELDERISKPLGGPTRGEEIRSKKSS
jgi:hypothetical protein